jgi:hypothetical protein
MSDDPSTYIFRLLQWKYAIRLEGLGMKNSRGSVTASAKRQLNVRGNRDKVLARIEELLAEARSKKEAA